MWTTCRRKWVSQSSFLPSPSVRSACRTNWAAFAGLKALSLSSQLALRLKWAAPLLLVVACAGDSLPKEVPPVLEGVVETQPIEPKPGVVAVEAIDETTVDVYYDVGSCGGESDALSQARAIEVAYLPDEIIVRVDGTVANFCLSDYNDIAVSRGSRLTLTESIGGRTLRIEQTSLLGP